MHFFINLKTIKLERDVSFLSPPPLGSWYPAINRAVEALVNNNNRSFPDFQDVSNLVDEVSSKEKLALG